MESLFFNAGERHVGRSLLSVKGGEGIRADISNGVLFFYLRTGSLPFEREVYNYDRLAMLLISLQGGCEFTTREGAPLKERAERSTVLAAGGCRLRLRIAPNSCLFALAVGDFFLKRYLGAEDVTAKLYRIVQQVEGIWRVDSVPTDALSHHMVDKVVDEIGRDTFSPLKMEHTVMALWLHRMALMHLTPEDTDPETLRIARCARGYLTAHCAQSPTIAQLARHCATNTTRLKRAFKQVYGRTVGAYLRALRLQQANELLKNRELSVKEVARMVGYNHQGHFGRLFYQTYGIYPRDLRKSLS